jgi:hypothetical protein
MIWIITVRDRGVHPAQSSRGLANARIWTLRQVVIAIVMLEDLDQLSIG